MSKNIKDFLKRENVRIVEQADGWQDAINISTRPLVEQGFITENYPKKIIELTCKHGAYYVMGKDLALVHARPEDGVLHQQLGVTVIKKPVIFDGKEDEPVRLFITLCAEDNNSHIDILQNLAEILMDERRVEKCANMTDPQELYTELISA